MLRDQAPRALGWLAIFAVVLAGTWAAGRLAADFAMPAPAAPFEITAAPSAVARELSAGLPSGAETTAPAPAIERFELLGLLHARSERSARAVIRSTGVDKPGVYAVGDTVGAGATLERITPDTAELSVSGRRIALQLPAPAARTAEKKNP